MPSLGERIRHAIKESGRTQKDVAKLVGIAENTLVNYIKGKRIPDAETVAKIGGLCGVSLDWLITGKGSMQPAPSVRDEESASDVVEAMQAGKISPAYAKAKIEALMQRHENEFETLRLILATIESLAPEKKS